MCTDKFKKDVEMLQDRFKAGAHNKELYHLIEQLVKEEEQLDCECEGSTNSSEKL